jgi:hypothetical protein
MQMSEKLLNYQKYFNLMKILHFYLKVAIIRQINAIVFKVKLVRTRLFTDRTKTFIQASF